MIGQTSIATLTPSARALFRALKNNTPVDLYRPNRVIVEYQVGEAVGIGYEA